MPDNFYRRQIQRILLIRPPLTIAKFESKSLVCPLGLGYVASVLEDSYKVKIFDCLAEGFYKEEKKGKFITYGSSVSDIRERIESFQPDIVGVGCLFSTQYRHALDVCKIAKEANPKIITIMGGSHPSASPLDVLDNPEVDFVVIGEAEESIIQLLDSFKGNGDFSLIDGIGYRENNGIKVNPKTRYISELDSLPLPSRHLLPMDVYFRINRPHGIEAKGYPNTNMITSRGCPARCIFCSIHTVFGNKYRARSPEAVLSEIEFLKTEYGINEVQFEDDNLTFDKERSRKIFEGMIKRHLNISWAAPNGVALWALDNELLKLIKDSGCWHLALGIESGDQEVLQEIIGKPLRLDKVKSLIKQMSRLKIKTTSFFVIGFPGESSEQINRTLKFALSLPADDINFYFASPYPGTRLYELAREKNLLRPDFNLEELKVSEINILPADISLNQLRRMVARAIILFRLKRTLKKPHIFILKWLGRLIREPRGTCLKVLRLIKDFLP